IERSEQGVPQGGSISVVLSNLSLHYVLELWVERVVKPRLQGEAYLIRYSDDVVVCFQHQADAQRFQQVLAKRRAKFALALESTKPRLVAFGRFAERDAKRNGKRLETFTFLGFTYTAHATTVATSRWNGRLTSPGCSAVWPNSIGYCRLFGTNR